MRCQTANNQQENACGENQNCRRRSGCKENLFAVRVARLNISCSFFDIKKASALGAGQVGSLIYGGTKKPECPRPK